MSVPSFVCTAARTLCKATSSLYTCLAKSAGPFGSLATCAGGRGTQTHAQGLYPHGCVNGEMNRSSNEDRIWLCQWLRLSLAGSTLPHINRKRQKGDYLETPHDCLF